MIKFFKQLFCRHHWYYLEEDSKHIYCVCAECGKEIKEEK